MSTGLQFKVISNFSAWDVW